MSSMITPDASTLYTNSKIEKAFEAKAQSLKTYSSPHQKCSSRRKESLFMPKTPYEGIIGKTGLMKPSKFSGYKEKGKRDRNSMITTREQLVNFLLFYSHLG